MVDTCPFQPTSVLTREHVQDVYDALKRLIETAQAKHAA